MPGSSEERRAQLRESQRKHRQRQQSEVEQLQLRVQALKRHLKYIYSEKEKLQSMLSECLSLMTSRQSQLEIRSSCYCQPNVPSEKASVASPAPDKAPIAPIEGGFPGKCLNASAMGFNTSEIMNTIFGERRNAAGSADMQGIFDRIGQPSTQGPTVDQPEILNSIIADDLLQIADETLELDFLGMEEDHLDLDFVQSLLS